MPTHFYWRKKKKSDVCIHTYSLPGKKSILYSPAYLKFSQYLVSAYRKLQNWVSQGHSVKLHIVWYLLL